jgi:hypothetical protein
LGFAEICHILVQKGPESLSNNQLGGDNGAIYFDLMKLPTSPAFDAKYHIIKKLQRVRYHK